MFNSCFIMLMHNTEKDKNHALILIKIVIFIQAFRILEH